MRCFHPTQPNDDAEKWPDVYKSGETANVWQLSSRVIRKRSIPSSKSLEGPPLKPRYFRVDEEIWWGLCSNQKKKKANWWQSNRQVRVLWWPLSGTSLTPAVGQAAPFYSSGGATRKCRENPSTVWNDWRHDSSRPCLVEPPVWLPFRISFKWTSHWRTQQVNFLVFSSV